MSWVQVMQPWVHQALDQLALECTEELDDLLPPRQFDPSQSHRFQDSSMSPSCSGHADEAMDAYGLLQHAGTSSRTLHLLAARETCSPSGSRLVPAALSSTPRSSTFAWIGVTGAPRRSLHNQLLLPVERRTGNVAASRGGGIGKLSHWLPVALLLVLQGAAVVNSLLSSGNVRIDNENVREILMSFSVFVLVLWAAHTQHQSDTRGHSLLMPRAPRSPALHHAVRSLFAIRIATRTLWQGVLLSRQPRFAMAHGSGMLHTSQLLHLWRRTRSVCSFCSPALNVKMTLALACGLRAFQ